LIGHVRVVAVLSMIEGVLELMLAALCLLVGVLGVGMRAQFIREFEKGGDPNAHVFVNFVTIFYCSAGIVMLIIGGMRIYAGLRNYFFQGRALGIVSVCLGFAGSVTGICALPAIGLGVYALIVYFNKEATEAFQMRSQGATADDVIKAFHSRPA
jgi:hypothetical protein